MPTSKPANGIASGASDRTSSPLLDLAPELRNQIYHHLLPEDEHLLVGAASATVGILRTCKIIRSEAGGIFHSRNNFHIKLSGRSLDLKCAQSWIKHLRKYNHHVKNLVIDIGLSDEGKARVDEEIVERAKRTHAIVHRPTVAAELAKTDAILLAATLLEATAARKRVGGIEVNFKRASARELSSHMQQKAYNNAAPPAFWRALDSAIVEPC